MSHDSAGDAVEEALAEFCSMEFEDANDIDASIRAWARAAQAFGYAGIRLTSKWDETWLSDSVTERLFDAASAIDTVAGHLEEFADFSVLHKI